MVKTVDYAKKSKTVLKKYINSELECRKLKSFVVTKYFILSKTMPYTSMLPMTNNRYDELLSIIKQKQIRNVNDYVRYAFLNIEKSVSIEKIKELLNDDVKFNNMKMADRYALCLTLDDAIIEKMVNSDITFVNDMLETVSKISYIGRNFAKIYLRNIKDVDLINYDVLRGFLNCEYKDGKEIIDNLVKITNDKEKLERLYRKNLNAFLQYNNYGRYYTYSNFVYIMSTLMKELFTKEEILETIKDEGNLGIYGEYLLDNSTIEQIKKEKEDETQRLIEEENIERVKKFKMRIETADENEIIQIGTELRTYMCSKKIPSNENMNLLTQLVDKSIKINIPTGIILKIIYNIFDWDCITNDDLKKLIIQMAIEYEKDGSVDKCLV